MADENTRRLIPMSVKKLDDNLYSIEIDGAESYKVECDYDSIRKVFRRIKAKDGENCGKCKSKKVGTYASMVGEENNTDSHKINVWKSKVPHSAEAFMKLCENKEEGINMKTITLTKNYLIEGSIFLKGTRIEFKEKLDFLPEEIWNKACDIEDEHERFEFIKAELNKLGDDYSDDEISDFINKYKNELNESVKKISKEDLEDMVMIVKETLEAEENIDKSLFDDIVKACKENKELVGYWESMLTANDKQFPKLENKFWDLFDSICSKVKSNIKVA